MQVSELAKRYAKAIFEIAVENKTQEKVLAELRALATVFSKDPEISQFLMSPLVSTDDRKKMLKSALSNKGVSQEVHDLLLLLANNGRFELFHDVVLAFEGQIDSANNVVRGQVRSASTLGQAERQQIEQTVEKVLKKKVIMTYKVDPSVIGGLVAQVGSHTFDDSIASHLRRMGEELKYQNQ